jgi:hypothetical protein
MNMKITEPVAAAPPVKPEKSFGPVAEAFLTKLYAEYRITATEGKIKVLEDKLGGPSNFYGMGGEVNDEMKLACLEYEYLERQGQIKLTFA